MSLESFWSEISIEWRWAFLWNAFNDSNRFFAHFEKELKNDYSLRNVSQEWINKSLQLTIIYFPSYQIELINKKLEGKYILNKLKDLSPLKNSTIIELLFLEGNEIEDASALIGKESLQSLDLSNNRLKNADFLESYFPFLEDVGLSGNYITEFPNLGASISLKEVDFSNNKIEDISKLKSLKYLIGIDSINLSNNPIKDFSPFSSLKKIDRISVSNTGLKELTPFENYSYINHLIFENNEVKDLSPIRLLNLRGIHAKNNKIREIESFTTSLDNSTIVIDLSGNPIEDISPLKNFIWLWYLLLFDTLATDFSALEELTKLKSIGVEKSKLTDESWEKIKRKNSDCQLFPDKENLLAFYGE